MVWTSNCWSCIALQIIVKEKGVFTNVISPTSKAKLRLLFEVAPLGLLVEKASRHSSDGKQSVLDKVISFVDERTQVSYGSKNEIIRFFSRRGNRAVKRSKTIGLGNYRRKCSVDGNWWTYCRYCCFCCDMDWFFPILTHSFLFSLWFFPIP